MTGVQTCALPIFKLGFLDGKAGYVHAYLQAYWFRFLVDAKIMEQEMKNKHDKK